MMRPGKQFTINWIFYFNVFLLYIDLMDDDVCEGPRTDTEQKNVST